MQLAEDMGLKVERRPIPQVRMETFEGGSLQRLRYY